MTTQMYFFPHAGQIYVETFGDITLDSVKAPALVNTKKKKVHFVPVSVAGERGKVYVTTLTADDNDPEVVCDAMSPLFPNVDVVDSCATYDFWMNA